MDGPGRRLLRDSPPVLFPPLSPSRGHEPQGGGIGVAIVWAVKMPPDYQNVRLLALTHWEPSPQTAPRHVLGFTQTVPEGRGTRAYVFYSRVLRTAQKFGVPLEKLLAVSMAHELGHTLLPDASHASEGIMRAPWDYFDLRAASNGGLYFSEDSAVLIRRRAAEFTASPLR